MKRQLLLLLFLAVTVLAFAQEEQIEKIDLTGILNSPFDIEVAESADGKLWAIHSYIDNAINSALMMYDGDSWVAQNFPCNSCLRDIKVDKGGTLWAAADTEGIYKYVNGQWVQVISNTAIKIGFKADGTLKFINRDGIFSYANEVVTEGNNNNKPSFFTITDYEIDLENRLWILISDKIYQYSDNEGWVHRDEAFNPIWIESAPDNKLWVAGNTGALSYFENGTYKFNQITGVFPTGQKATALTIDHDNIIYVGIQGDDPGMTSYNDGIVKTYTSQQLVNSSQPLSKIFVTSSSEVWIFENYNNTIGHIYQSEVMEPVDLDQDGFNSDVDCDDNDPLINPEAEEVANNDIDENCDGEMLVIDEDQDGFNSDVDCDDSDPLINPEADEVANNEIDENCDGEMLVIDDDQDGFNSDVDCDDNDPLINPEAEEVANNEIDENCDGEMLVIDVDQDGFNSDVDCDDNNPAINPGAFEIENNDIDEDCDGEKLIIDNDNDGFNSDVDCNDTDATINPDAIEVANNDTDENCDGEFLQIDEDQDGFNSAVDCDDSDALINPDATEVPNNGIDENCDGEDATSSVQDFDAIKISISPNPSRGNSRISFSEIVVDANIGIYTLDGKLIKSISSISTILYLDLNTSNMQKGLYIVKLISSKQEFTAKLIVE